LHRGGKTDEVIATAVPCLEREGYTDIHFTQPRKLTLSFNHEFFDLPFFHSKHRFAANGKKYFWKGHTELVEEEHDVLCATFTPSWLEDKGHRIGQLVVTGDGKDIMDIIVFTALIVQERTDEYKASVNPSCNNV
jgi:hypothetical protein